MKQFTTPGVKETRAIILRIRVTKSRKSVGRARIEAIKSTLETRLNEKKGYSENL